MSGQEVETGWAIHSSMHKTREKQRQLGASLLLTSSFAQQKQHFSRQRRQRIENQATTQANYHQQVLLAKRINQAKQTDPPSQAQPLSSIDQLKTHARKLMDEHTTKLGKQNELQPPQELNIIAVESEQLESGSFRVCKKPNKRRIIKGRPEMYTVSKRRAFLMNILDQKPENHQPKGIIHELLNKNNLLKFISTHNQKAESRNLYDNLERHRTLEECNAGKKPMQAHRKSLTCYRANEGGIAGLQQLNKHASEGQSEGMKGYVCASKKRRYSGIKTIE